MSHNIGFLFNIIYTPGSQFNLSIMENVLGIIIAFLEHY